MTEKTGNLVPGLSDQFWNAAFPQEEVPFFSRTSRTLSAMIQFVEKYRRKEKLWQEKLWQPMFAPAALEKAKKAVSEGKLREFSQSWSGAEAKYFPDAKELRHPFATAHRKSVLKR